MIALGSDNAGLELKNRIMAYLDGLGLKYKDFGTFVDEKCDYPVYAVAAANAVAVGECEKGILVCGTGVGISIAANKVRGIRCVVCSEPYSALMSRRHNDTNMLALGARVLGIELALVIVKAWLDSEFDGGRHSVRVKQIMDIEDRF